MIKLSLFYFIVSLFFGILILYTIHPKPKIIIKYLSLDSLSNIVYKDNRGICYNYEMEQVRC